MATDGSGEEIHLNTPPDGRALFPMWAPDGKTIVFACHQPIRGGVNKLIMGLWLIHVIDGKQVGEPQLVTRVGGLPIPAGFTRDGCLYYGILSGLHSSGINVVSLDMETGELLSQPMPLRSDGSNTSPVWSPDGKKLAYLSNRIYQEGTEYRPAGFLVIRSMEIGGEREILPNPQILIQELFGWSPDGRAILFYGGYGGKGSLAYGGTIGIYLIDAQTGEITTAVKGHPRISLWDAVWSRDGKTIYYTRTLEERGERHGSIMAHNLATGEEQELYTGGILCKLCKMLVSPDGQKIVFTDDKRQKLQAILTTGGEIRTLFDLQLLDLQSDKPRDRIYPITWTPDGHHVLFHIVIEDVGVYERELWRIPAEGGQAQNLGEEPLE